ncbi:MAG TPA: hypothetical protein VIE43_11305 [Thermoanaerobaculia bacterium]|nr:hypothetical protein [Thermoanaerobaculia bacterium]
MPFPLAPLPGLWVVFLALLLARGLRRLYDPVPWRCWLAWGVALVLLLGAVLFAGRTMLPVGNLGDIPPFTAVVQGEPHGNFLQSDLILQIAPWLARVREAYAAGSWPLWNPLAGAGEPLLANPQSQALQPLAWLALPFPVVAGFGVAAALRLLVAFVFTWLFLRRQEISATVALAGSLAYGLAGFLQLWLGWPLAGSAAFLPVLLYAITLVDQRGARRDLALLALATAALLLVGHPETSLHVFLFAAAFALSRLLARPAGRRLALLGAWTLAAAIGAGLAAPLALPAAEYLPKSQRAALLDLRHERWRAGAAALGEEGHLSLGRLIPIAAANAFGNDRYGDYWGERNTNEDATGFAGSVVLLGALAAAWPLAAGRRFPQERLMLATAAVCLAIVARPAWLVSIFEAVPVLRHSQSYHGRVTLLLNLAMVYGAASAWERWRRGEIRPRRFLLLGAALVPLIVWGYLAHAGPEAADFGALRWGSLAVQIAALALALLLLARPGSSLRMSGLAAVAAAELIAFHLPAHPAARADLYDPVTPPIAFLQKRLDPWYRMAGLGPLLRPNLASVYGLADLRSANAAKPAAVQEALRPINRFPLRATEGLDAPENPLYGRLAVRFLIAQPGTFVDPPYERIFRRATAWIYQNPDALPFLYYSPQAPGPETSGLDLGTIEPEWLRARARLPRVRLLASSLYQDGNWKLLVGGGRRPTTLANGPFLAAWLPPGEADLDLLYRPGSFLAGLAVAALALAAGAALWAPWPQTADRSQAFSQRSA